MAYRKSALRPWLGPVLAIPAILGMVGVAHASDQDGTVIWYAADTNTSPYAFTVAGALTAKPPCATDDAWAITSPTTDGAKALLVGVITARAGNRQLSVHGSGVCDPTNPSREKVQYILFY
jgi:hypothetical protein